jgi:predicted Ser/Thr protein kinase
MTDQELYDAYMDNAAAYCQCTSLPSGNPRDENLMRKVEEALGIPVQGADDFRRNMLAKVATDERLKGSHNWREDDSLVYAIQQIVGGE